MSEKIGIIDLGSNSIRLMLMDVYKNGDYKLIDEVKEMVRLSENMGPEKVLKLPAIERTVNGIRFFKKICDNDKITRIIAVATAAIRDAKNKDLIMRKLYTSTNINFKILTGMEECYYDFLGVIRTIDIPSGYIMDIGGASTQLIKFKNNSIIDCYSLPMGTTTLAERFLDRDKSSEEQISNMERYIKEEFLSLPWIGKDEDLPLICVGGTLRNLCKVDMHRRNYSYKKIHNYIMDTASAVEIYDDYKFSDLKTRQNIPGLSKERADIFLSGIGILKCFIEINQPKNIVMSGCGLRDGIFFDYLIKTQSNYLKTSVLQASLDNAMKYYHINEAHAYQVWKLGQSIFEQLKPLHNLGEWEKKLLTVATLLHDCGVTINYYDKHKHNFYVISNSTFYGLDHREILLSAFATSAYQHPDIQNAWQRYENILQDGDDAIVKKLAVILRLAESLDKSELGIVKDVICNINQNEVVIKVISGENTQLEIANASKYAQQFYRIFNKKLRVL